ncbi:unnamed protein product [Rotaria socialis]|uniref:G-protein coupled receptors family 1 profile domain-containing protein n=5 Tax=Rotaria socialis TaxID=392032 RepID=A0A818FDZ9_9BILA|nr:unnamed protein product [Rotaria socialis]CAF3382846.1 unnamed protein product [Rotaria socialis]CAF3441998.1 unnamed protein product [Rotaria socialis]CAF3473266.1 unnamed protein product [Rotaria socialis]CAF3771093.1 unnamed protein product [Rotaria socialis]
MNTNQTTDIDTLITEEFLLQTDNLTTTVKTNVQYSRTGELIISIITYSIIIILSIIGNVIVVTAICRVQRLRHPTNFILMSLAIADLLVTTTVMIPGFIYEIKHEWIFGRVFCNVWVANDITFCTASILHLVAVSFDRYVAIENPLKYKQKMTKHMIFIIIGFIWLISVLLSYGPVLLGVYSQSKTIGNLSDSKECGMRPNRIYSIISSSTSFYIPLIIILFLYGRIFITARKHSKELQKLENIVKRLHSNEKFVFENAKWNKNIKAIRTLGIVVGVFVVCWLPFFVMYLLLAYCDYQCVNSSVERYITWIGYANSFCNPVIYAFSNKEFRNAFFEILHYNNCQCTQLLSTYKMRASLSKSNYSINTKYTPQAESRHASYTPYFNQMQRNGYLTYETSVLKMLNKPKKSESTDTFEMKTLEGQRPTLEAFNELEHFVQNTIPDRAIIAEMSSLLYDQDDVSIEIPVIRKTTATSHSNNS